MSDRDMTFTSYNDIEMTVGFLSSVPSEYDYEIEFDIDGPDHVRDSTALLSLSLSQVTALRDHLTYLIEIAKADKR